MARGRVGLGMLLNHGCDIDKKSNKRLLFAFVAPIGLLLERDQELVAAGASKSKMFLPNLPTIGDAYVDLSIYSTVERPTVDAAIRLAALTDQARFRLQAQLFMFYTRRDFSAALNPGP